MPRRYRRSAVEFFERMDVPIVRFPTGVGASISIGSHGGEWTRLGMGQGTVVPLEGGSGGAFAWGMVISRALVWIRLDPSGGGCAYCYHAPPGPLAPAIFTTALRALECGPPEIADLWVVIGSRHDVAPEDEAFFLARGIQPGRILAYSNSLTPEFGVSARGCVGEAR